MKSVLITLSALSVLSLSSVAWAGPSGQHPFMKPMSPRVTTTATTPGSTQSTAASQTPRRVWSSSHTSFISPSR